MSYFDIIRFQFGTLSAEHKLSILRAESLPLLSIVQGYGTLFHHTLEQQDSAAFMNDLILWGDTIVDRAKMLRDLIDALTIPQHHEGRGIPELRPYDTLLEAIQRTADKLALPLAEAIEDPTKVFVHNLYPLVLLDEPRYHREVAFSLVESRYAVQLLSWTKEQIFQVVHAVQLSSLDGVANVINQWLIEHRALEDITQQDE